MQEGMIDQGGGFRDTLAEIAEELCPSNPDSEVALPLFIRSPNQSQDSSNVYRDAYIPNPSCTQFARYCREVDGCHVAQPRESCSLSPAVCLEAAGR